MAQPLKQVAAQPIQDDSSSEEMTPRQRARNVFRHEAAALESVARRLDGNFDRAVEIILGCQGRVVLTGMGKHGLIARKIAATFASTGTPSFFMHPAEGCHGDLGMIESSDVILALSNSGNTGEVLGCVPYFKRNHNYLIGMTGNLKSELARQSDLVLDIGVEREACPLNLAPTTSTTVALAMGDALAVVLLELRGFERDDFAFRHPSGTLGKRLLLRVSDLLKPDQNPTIHGYLSFEQAIAEITLKKRGAVSVLDDSGRLAGILTDGDLRRIFQRAADSTCQTVAELLSRPVRELMTTDPAWVEPETLAAKALSIMEDGPRKIFVLPVLDKEQRPVAMLHLHDLVSAGF